jgi:PadR family transcriptional regulator, regulatory protein PadR
MEDALFFNKLLEAWELTFKKGQLSFWILLSLKQGPKFLDEIQAFMVLHSGGQLQFDEQSLYRSLRKFDDLELVRFSLHESNKGPNLKQFEITPLGKDLLQKFIDRNISLFYQPAFSAIIHS